MMKPEVRFHRFPGQVAFGLLPFQAVCGRLPALQAHSSKRPLKNSPSGHPQIAQGKQRDELRRILGQATVSDLAEPELAFDDPERVFHFCPHTGLELFGFVQQGAQLRLFIQCPAFARSHGHMPVHTRGFRPLRGTLVASIRKHHSFIAVQQSVALGNVIDVGRSANDGVDQSRVGINPDVGLHTEVPLVAFLGLMHFRVTLAAAVLGGTGCGNQGGIDHGANFEHQALGGQGGIDGGHDLDAQVVFFEQMAKPQNGGFVRQPGDACVQSGKLAVQGRIMQGFFHGRIRKTEPLLHEVDAQHGRYRKGRASGLTGRRMRFNQRNQFSQRHHQVHLIKKLALARPLGDKFKSGGGKADLFHRYSTFVGPAGLTYAENP